VSGTSDLNRLVDLRSLREERAKTAVTIATARLRDAAIALSDAEAAMEDHDFEIHQREQRFLAIIQIKPMPANQFGRQRDLLGASDQRREQLADRRNEAADALKACERELLAAQAEWRRRLFDRNRLAEAQARQNLLDSSRTEAVEDQEAEEMSADRAWSRC
jgi:hypothetical protein